MSVNAAKGLAGPEHFIRALSWLFAIGPQVGVNVVEAYLERFPTVCYYCISAPCVCHRTGKQPYRPMPAYKVQDERAAFSNIVAHKVQYENIAIDYDWIKNNICSIYPNNEILWYHSGPGFHFTKLLEEMAELHQALSKWEGGDNRLANVATELADVFAWIVATWQLAMPGKNLREEFITHYYEGCPVCNGFPCSCGSRRERSSGIVTLPQLRELSKRLDELSGVLGSRKNELQDIKASIEKAIDSKDEQVAVQAVAQTKSRMETLRETVSDIDESGKKAVSIIENVSLLASKLLNLVDLIRPFIPHS